MEFIQAWWSGVPSTKSALYFNKEDVWLSIGDTGTSQNGIIWYSMHEKAKMNTYEQLLVEKVWKKCNWCQKRKNKGKEFS